MSIHAESNIILSTIPAKTSLLGGHFLYKSTTSQSGATPPSANVIQVVKKNGIDVSNDPTQWEFNTHIGANGIKLRYNEIPLTTMTTNGIDLYSPVISQGVIASSQYGMRLTSAGIDFYNPGTAYDSQSNPSIAAELSSAGLKIVKGGIEAGNAQTNGYIYISTEDYPLANPSASITGITINNHTPSVDRGDGTPDPAWRLVVGTKFGVDSEGNLYAGSADITGAITATSLTIGEGSNTYNGYDAINVSGYSIAITQVANTETLATLTAILYHNGKEVTNDSTKADQSGYEYDENYNPNNFIWYQVGSTTAVATGQTYDAVYGHSYQATYEFDDGATQSGSNIQTLTVDPQKYITKISNTGIKIHPEGITDDYIQIDGDIDIVRDGISVAQYGTTARIGAPTSSRFEINTDSLKGYDNNGNLYFQVTNNGLTWGSNNNAATTLQVANAAKVAENYITWIDNNGIYVSAVSQNPTSENPGDSIRLDTTGLEIFQNNNSIAKYGNIVRIGQTGTYSFYITINSDKIEFHRSWGSQTDERVTGWISGDGIRIGNGPSAIDSKYTYAFGEYAVANNFNCCAIGFGATAGVVRDTVTQDKGKWGATAIGVIDSSFYLSNPSSSLAVARLAADGIGSFVRGYIPRDNFLENDVRGYAGVAGIEAIGTGSHAEGYAEGPNMAYSSYESSFINVSIQALGIGSHAEGVVHANIPGVEAKIIASGIGSHAEGVAITSDNTRCLTEAAGMGSHAEGCGTQANGAYSHTEGYKTTTGSPGSSHAEGYQSFAYGQGSHAEGCSTFAFGLGDHTSGILTQTLAGSGQVAIGIANVVDTSDTIALSIGNGSFDKEDGEFTNVIRSNALTVNRNGNVTIAGTLTQSSDRRLKEHIEYLNTNEEAIEFIRQLKPVHFKRKEKSYLGFYAQDVEEIDPWNCMTGEMNGFKTLGYTEIIAPLVAYCQHLEERIKQLEEKE